MPDPLITIADPEAVRVGRVSDSGQDWIVCTYEFEYEHEDHEARIALLPDDFVDLLVSGLLGLGFPQEDVDYITDRYNREFR